MKKLKFWWIETKLRWKMKMPEYFLKYFRFFRFAAFTAGSVLLGESVGEMAGIQFFQDWALSTLKFTFSVSSLLAIFIKLLVWNTAELQEKMDEIIKKEREL